MAKASGAQNRKAKAERVAREAEQRKEIGALWSSAPSYSSGLTIEDTGAIELPLYGQQPPILARAVAAVLVQLEQGAFASAAYLADGMLRDERIASALQTRIGGLLGAPFEMLPGVDTATGRKAAEAAEKLWPRMAPNAQLFEFMRYALLLSVGIAQVLTARDVKSTTPTIRVWNPRFLRFDWLTRRYALVTENAGEILIQPGDPEWMIYEPFGPHGWLSGALMRQLVQPWLIRYWTRAWWARHQEIHGQPIRLGVIPADRKPEDERTFLSQLKNIGSDTVIRIPQGEEGNKFDVKLLEAAATSWQGFEGLLRHCDDSIAVSILGQRQSTAGQGGLGSQEKAGESTIVRVLQQDAKVGDAIRSQVLVPWAEQNYGDPECAPYPCWEIEPPEDLAEKAKTLLTFAQAVAVFAGLPPAERHVNIRELEEAFELPLRPEEEVAAEAEESEAQAAEIAGQAPSGADGEEVDDVETDDAIGEDDAV